INSQPIIKGNNISYNHGWGGGGGGIFCLNSSLTITDNYLYQNSSFSISSSFTPTGGGIYCERSPALIQNNLISHNDSYEGGGIACMEEPAPQIINNTIVFNISKYTSPGGVVAYWSPIILTNNIIYYNGWDSQVIVHYVTPTVTYNDLEDYQNSQAPPDNNFGLAPEFVDTSKEDYHLKINSPCIDAGNPKSNFSFEPSYNGGRINLGMFGNTSGAAISDPEMELTKSAIIFDTLVSAGKDTVNLWVRNSGVTRLNLDSIYVIPTNNFEIYFTDKKYILPGDSLEIHAVFKPQIPGNYLGNIVIISNNLKSNLSYVSLSGFYDFRAAPVISDISDVPNDEGGWVKISFTKSKYDNDSLSLSKILSPEMYSIEIKDTSGWIAAANLLAYGRPLYTALVHTTKDSTTDHSGLTGFRVIAGMNEGNFVSAEKFGYSVDN
ncbi:MAG: hypothetical protein P8Z35_25370, partial [Ignavibacteriaceae bacterium]